MAPIRGAKMVSPVPTVTDAMIAPGPNTLSSAVQPPLISGDGGGYAISSRISADAVAMGSRSLAQLYSRA